MLEGSALWALQKLTGDSNFTLNNLLNQLTGAFNKLPAVEQSNVRQLHPYECQGEEGRTGGRKGKRSVREKGEVNVGGLSWRLESF